jgi:hypothetical protein
LITTNAPEGTVEENGDVRPLLFDDDAVAAAALAEPPWWWRWPAGGAGSHEVEVQKSASEE